MNDFSNHKYTINYNALMNHTGSWTITTPSTWGSIVVTFPLADVEAIDARVEGMTEFPEVLELLKKL